MNQATEYRAHPDCVIHGCDADLMGLRQCGGPCKLAERHAKTTATMEGMALSNKEKQEAFRQRRAEEGLQEVRGIFLPPDLHADLKEYARKLAKKRSPAITPGKDVR